MYQTLYQVSNDKPENYSITDDEYSDSFDTSNNDNGKKDEYSDSFDTSNNDNGKKVVIFCSLVYCTT